MKTMRFPRFILALLSAAFVLSACSGDSRPFEESVETNQLDLQSIVIEPPPNSIEPVFINTGEKVKFSIVATNKAGDEFALSSEKRRWWVEQPELASIDADGNLIAKANGSVRVGVQIGSLPSAIYSLTVSNAELASINPIVEVDLDPNAAAMPSSIERCIPESYTATGLFSDGTSRRLPEIVWEVVNPEQGSVESLNGNTAEVIGTNAGNLELIARVGNVASNPPKMIDVENNLLRIDFLPAGNDLEVKVGKTLPLSAIGVYNRENVTTKELEERSTNITRHVQWSLTSNSGFATVSNQSPTKGTVTGVEVGAENITAECGDKFEEKLIQVVASTSSENLTFFSGDTRNVSLAEGNVQLQVSTGSEFNLSNAVTTDAGTTWSLVSSQPEPGVIELSTTGLVTPRKQGTAVVKVTVGDDEAQITIIVGP